MSTPDLLPAWLRAHASITLDNKITLHGLSIRDAAENSEVFVAFRCSCCVTAVGPGTYEVDPELRAKLEPQILAAYQRAQYPWLDKHPAPLHSLTLEILDGLREYYDMVDLGLTQQRVNAKVIKLLRKKKHWSQEDYLAIKDKVEPIIEKVDALIVEEP
jgi:DNA-binding cell septation regulator SpoVG